MGKQKTHGVLHLRAFARSVLNKEADKVDWKDLRISEPDFFRSAFKMCRDVPPGSRPWYVSLILGLGPPTERKVRVKRPPVSAVLAPKPETSTPTPRTPSVPCFKSGHQPVLDGFTEELFMQRALEILDLHAHAEYQMNGDRLTSSQAKNRVLIDAIRVLRERMEHAYRIAFGDEHIPSV